MYSNFRAVDMHDEEDEKGTVCGGCKKLRARLRFSNNQWNQYKQRKYKASSQHKDLKKVEKPMCRECNGEPAVEKRCSSCEKLLPLDKFSKTARKNRDNMKCINCTQNWEDLEADPHAAVTEQRIYDDLEETGGKSTWTMQKSLGSALPSDIGSRSAWDSVSNTGTNPETENDGVWIQQETSSNRFRNSDSNPDLTETPHGPASTINTKDSNGTWTNFPIEHSRQRQQGSSTTNANTGFYKQGAYREPVKERVASRWRNDQVKKEEARVDAADSDSDSDDDSDGNVLAP